MELKTYISFSCIYIWLPFFRRNINFKTLLSLGDRKPVCEQVGPAIHKTYNLANQISYICDTVLGVSVILD